ncbi:MAG: cytochrome c4 [Gammaproteobacteria bacterium]|nr:cytochrome c4 [Rhodocyclaceae bacterium]MBU3908085.1 cytochrome c4 [Gammaproteobacteria bacterium]MBU4005726.1 cytochrome c4 [Gammaproteobacteria bacterium]MBU4021526.1 cytochrome c4 [Gammaproteobacteria bacterium]MBU4097286.1 cytochrome c4 [Gammaproteobacteria bacterium]
MIAIASPSLFQSHLPHWALLALLALSVMPHQAVASDARAIATTICAACHGADGNSTDPAYPKIAGMDEGYLLRQLRYFASGKRRNEVMETIIKDIREADFSSLANYYSAQKPLPGKVNNAQLAAVGKRLYEDGNTETGVPACAGCHQPDGDGNARFPRLAGQHQVYTLQQLGNYHSGRRATDRLMVAVAQRLSADEMKALAEYVAGL